MKKQIAIALVLFFTTSIFSQIKYEKGYFIDNSKKRTECLIKNIDWKNNPNEIIYKLNESGTKLNSPIENILEFGINQDSKYERHTVNIDVSSQNLQHMDANRNPNWEKQTLFLRVLVEGNSILYKNSNDDLGFKYFYKIKNKQVKQLIYKYYLTKKGNKAENLTYLDQLSKNVNCENKTTSELKYVKYNENSLVKYFEHDNLCKDPSLNSNLTYKKNKFDFNLKITPGININSFSFQNDFKSDYNEIDFDSKITFRLGLEAELIFPFNKNKWSLFVEPNYHYYNTEKSFEVSNGTITIITEETVNIDLSSIEIPIGFRHYMFLKNNSKVFIDAMVVFESYLSSQIKFKVRRDLDEIKSPLHLGFGIGYSFNNKYSIACRYYTNKDPLTDYFYWNSNLNQFSLIFAYNVL
ncbi:MAG: outer membrane beta-barrel protein [Bacteroidota bacterium]